MSATAIRLKKEVRAILWPWAAVMLLGVLPALHSTSSTRKLNLFSFFIGAPLLAVLALGNEFQQKTFNLWLTQPLARARLWAEKMAVALAAGLAVMVVSGTVTFSYIWPHVDAAYVVAAYVAVIAAAFSAPFWTLVTKSTVGGFTLVICHLVSCAWIARFIADQDQLTHPSAPPGMMTALVAAIGYSLLMLWLGARRITRLQITGGSEDDDLLMSDRTLLPATVAGWLRCRPSGAYRNLARKEIRLLLPFWFFAALVLGYLALMARFGLVVAFPLPIPEKDPALSTWIAFMSLGCFSVLLPIFAGLLSLGSEKTAGTHAWNLSLPGSSLRQWAMKLGIAMLAGFTCTVMLPLVVVIAVGASPGSPYMLVNFRDLGDWMRLVPVMTFAAFWCACAASGTMRASVWVAAAPVPVFFSRPVGDWLARIVIADSGTLRDVVVSRFHLNPLEYGNLTAAARGTVLWLFLPTLLFAVFQSYRLYRRPQEESAGWVIRCLAPLVLVTILWNFAVSAGFLASHWEPFEETHRALDSLQLRTDTAQFTADLARSSILTPLTRRWLQGSIVNVTRGGSPFTSYVAAIHLAGGADCKLTVFRSGGTAATCQNR